MRPGPSLRWVFLRFAVSVRQQAVEEGDDLAPGAGGLGQEAVLVALQNACVHGPGHGLGGVGGELVEVLELPDGHAALGGVQPLGLGKAEEDGRHLLPGDGGVGTEAAVSVAGDDAEACRPADRLGAVGVRRHIGERRAGADLGLAGGPPEEGHGLAPGAGAAGVKGGGRLACGDAPLRGPADGAGVGGVGGNVGEGGLHRLRRGGRTGAAAAAIAAGGLAGQLIDRQGAGDLAGRQQQGLAGPACRRRDEAEALGGHVALDVGREFPGVDVVDEGGLGGVGDVIDHHAADALQGDESVGSAVDGAHGGPLRLGALLAGAVLQADVVVGAVEEVREVLGGDGLEGAAAVIDLLQAAFRDAQDGEGAAAEEVVHAALQAVILAGVEPGHLFLEGLAVGRRLALDLVDIGLRVHRPGTGVALVGGDEIGGPIHLIEGDGVRHPDALQVIVGVGGVGLVIVAEVDGDLGVVLKAHGINAGELTLCDVQHGDGVGLLAGDVGGVVVAGDVLRLQIHGGEGVLLQDDALRHQGLAGVGAVKGGEVHGFGSEGGRFDDGHGTLGVHRALSGIAQSGLALVGGEDEP